MPLFQTSWYRGIVIMTVIVVFGCPGIEILVIGDDHASLTGGEGLHGVKRKSSHLAEGAQGFALPSAPAGLGRIFDDGDMVFHGHPHDFFDPGHGSAHMNGQDRFCARGDTAGQVVGIQAEGVVDFREYGNCAGIENGFPGGDKGEALGDDLIAGRNTQRCKSDAESRRSG